jgi:hypothetical protein
MTFEICTAHLTGYLVRKLLNSILDHSTETASDDDTLDVSDDDFFVSGSSSDEEADDEWTDKSAKYDSQTTASVLTCSYFVFTWCANITSTNLLQGTSFQCFR